MSDTQSFGGPWTQEKLKILRKYLNAYTTALKNRSFNLIYIDAFAGSGTWRPKSMYDSCRYDEFKEMLKGSPNIALDIDDKPFDQLIFIERNPKYVSSLKILKSKNTDRDIKIINNDANLVLPNICSRLNYRDRAVVFLDPYATEVNWSTIETIAETQKIDCWILFPLMAITRLMPRGREPDPDCAKILNRVFGGRDWCHNIYSRSEQYSFWSQGNELEREKGSDKIAEAYGKRLKTKFASVAPTNRVLKNSNNSNLFTLFFAVSNPDPKAIGLSLKIANHILEDERF